MGDTKIEWTDKTWSPVRARVRDDAAVIAARKGYESLLKIAGAMAGRAGPHCERVSHGCDNCYSDTNNHRCLPANGTGLPFDRRARDLVGIVVDPNIIDQPLRWKTPKKVFVENQSDLFGEWVPDAVIDRVLATMARCPRHTFQVLTKRPERMRDYFRTHAPLPNVWLGVSAENRETADQRIPLLLETPAAIRFCSYEPALGPVDFTGMKLDWIIVGGESGAGARPFDIAWARQTIEQNKGAGTAVFVKQLGALPIVRGEGTVNTAKAKRVPAGSMPLAFRDAKGGDWSEWPEDLRVREFPGALKGGINTRRAARV